MRKNQDIELKLTTAAKYDSTCVFTAEHEGWILCFHQRHCGLNIVPGSFFTPSAKYPLQLSKGFQNIRPGTTVLAVLKTGTLCHRNQFLVKRFQELIVPGTFVQMQLLLPVIWAGQRGEGMWRADRLYWLRPLRNLQQVRWLGTRCYRVPRWVLSLQERGGVFYSLQ